TGASACMPMTGTSMPSRLEELGFGFENSGAPAKVANLDEVKGCRQALTVFVALLGRPSFSSPRLPSWSPT
ncbi:MAG TPA: hypothetical protein VGR26_16825, partial [Acidimicrobiales bacterium]|nr:hypothetical protein [Acidimicrobiales bacterium]